MATQSILPNSLESWVKAKRHLKASDPVICTLIEKAGSVRLQSRGDAFVTLLRSIVGQQISVKAAATIWGRIEGEFECTPKGIFAADSQSLHQLGLSVRKVSYVKDLAEHFLKINGKTLKVELWDQMSDEEIIEDLIQVRGIGRWTAEMFLIFNLLRPDVFPIDDLGLNKAISIYYKKRYPLSKKSLLQFKKRFSPWGSVATWYLWRALDPVPVEY